MHLTISSTERSLISAIAARHGALSASVSGSPLLNDCDSFVCRELFATRPGGSSIRFALRQPARIKLPHCS